MAACKPFLLFFLIIPFISGARILLGPLSGPSHVMYFTVIGKDLIQRGHSVDMILTENFPIRKELAESGISTFHWHIKTPENFIKALAGDVEVGRHMLRTNFHVVAMHRYFSEELLSACTNALSDDYLFESLKKRNYDLAIMDGIVGCRCQYILPYKLDVPIATLTTQYEPWLYRIPALPSFVPFAMGATFTEKMTFTERLHNLFATIDAFIKPISAASDDSLITTYAPEKPPISMTELARQSVLWFINTDPAIDYARPTMPNVVNVGGLTTKPGEPLPKDVEDFLKDAPNGAILVSFGSVADLLPPEIPEKLLKAFLKLKQKIIWKYGGEPIKILPSNFKTMPWLPQNDILAHPNIKLFITHGGNNGQFEALYHGVPMIVGPYFGEQKYNALRVEYKGFGKAISLLDFKPDELVEMIGEMLSNPKYEKNIRQASEIFKSAPETARERLVYWVEHVLEFGGEHLRSIAVDMPWYQFCMLDILAFLLVVGVASLFIAVKLMKCMFRAYCSKSDNSKQTRE